MKQEALAQDLSSLQLRTEYLKMLFIQAAANGNLQGISKLVEGMKVEDVIAKLKGVRCGMKSTSCPDQLATALTAVLEKQKNA